MTTRTDISISPLDPQSCETKGRRQAHKQEFHLTFRGYEIYDILQILEGAACQGNSYLQNRPAFFAAETVRERAEADGW